LFPPNPRKRTGGVRHDMPIKGPAGIDLNRYDTAQLSRAPGRIDYSQATPGVTSRAVGYRR
jgi:hypothetical protein